MKADQELVYYHINQMYRLIHKNQCVQPISIELGGKFMLAEIDDKNTNQLYQYSDTRLIHLDSQMGVGVNEQTKQIELQILGNFKPQQKYIFDGKVISNTYYDKVLTSDGQNIFVSEEDGTEKQLFQLIQVQ